MSGSQQPDHTADIALAWAAGLAVTRDARLNAGIQQPISPLVLEQLNPDEEEDKIDYEFSETDIETNEDMLLSSSSEGQDGSSEEGTVVTFKELDREMNRQQRALFSGLPSEATRPQLLSARNAESHPALLAIVQAVRAFRRADLEQEADELGDWSVITFGMSWSAQAVVEAVALPDQTTEAADVEYAKEALKCAESELREEPVEGITLDDFRAVVEKCGEAIRDGYRVGGMTLGRGLRES